MYNVKVMWRTSNGTSLIVERSPSDCCVYVHDWRNQSTLMNRDSLMSWSISYVHVYVVSRSRDFSVVTWAACLC